jgi:hypothetical protein
LLIGKVIISQRLALDHALNGDPKHGAFLPGGPG